MQLTVDDKKLKAARELIIKNFSLFCQSLMSPEWFDEKFHTELCNFMQNSKPKKLIILPRTHLKTTVCATLYALWRATQNPNIRILQVSNTTPNAEKTVRAIRSIVESNKVYQVLFPECVPNFGKVRWSDRCACLNRKEDYPEGTFESAGVGANIIRRHFNIIIEDDTVAPKKDDLTGEECMPSRDDIEQAIGFHRLTTPLLINENDEVIVIGTRWASYDHINWILENEKFDVYNRPAIDEKGMSLYRRFSIERLEAIRMAMGTYLFSSLYLNQPLAKEQMVFNPDWIRYYEENELPNEGNGVVTHDPADPPTNRKSQDYSAIVSCKHTNKGVFVRRYMRDRVSDRQAIDTAIDYAVQDGALKIRVEIDRYAHLQFAYRERMRQRNVYFILEAVKTHGKQKEGRIRQRLQPMFENGVIFLKRGMKELENELYQFPNGAHDDLIDALAWQIEGVHPTEFKPPQVTIRRRLPTFEEMLQTLYSRQSRSKYPFDVQLGNELLTKPY